MPKNERYIVGLDIGTTKISCVVAEMRENGSVDIVGLGSAPSRGLRKGVVVNLDATVDAVKSCVEEAEHVNELWRVGHFAQELGDVFSLCELDRGLSADLHVSAVFDQMTIERLPWGRTSLPERVPALTPR